MSIGSEDRRVLQKKTLIVGVLLLICVCFSLCVDLYTGTFASPLKVLNCYGMWFSQLFAQITGGEVMTGAEIIKVEPSYFYLMTRAGTTFITAAAGVLLSLAGSLYQSVFKNPIASPSMLGVSSGISLGHVILVLVFGTAATEMIGAKYALSYGFAIGMLVVMFALAKYISGRGRPLNIINMLVIGTLLSQLIGAFILVLCRDVLACLPFVSSFLPIGTVVSFIVLSRKRVGTVVLLVGGLVLCAAMEYLYWGGHLVEFAVFGLSAAALIAYRGYQAGLRGSDTEQISFGSTVIAAVVIVALSAGLSAGVFAICVAPLDPPNLIVKLVTKHVRMDEQHMIGVGDAVDVENDDLTSSDTNDRQNPESDEESNGDQDQQQNMDDISRGDDDTVDNAGSTVNLDDYTDHDDGQAINTSVPDWAPFLIALLVVALVAAIIGGRKYLRRRRVEALRALPAEQRVRGMFLLFLKKFRRTKIPEPDHQTLFEYLVTVGPMVARFEQLEGSADPQWNELVGIYARVAYGHKTPTESELAAFDAYYNEFYRRARRYIGVVKYPVMFFRI